jgi:hypothetical protein
MPMSDLEQWCTTALLLLARNLFIGPIFIAITAQPFQESLQWRCQQFCTLVLD